MRARRAGTKPSVSFRRCSGVTMVELLVTLALLGLMAGVVGVSLRRVEPIPEVDERAARVARARSEALRAGRPVTITVSNSGRVDAVTVLPDGSVLADSALGFDRLTGRPIR